MDVDLYVYDLSQVQYSNIRYLLEQFANIDASQGLARMVCSLYIFSKKKKKKRYSTWRKWTPITLRKFLPDFNVTGLL